MFNYKVEAELNGVVIKTEYVTGTYEDAESVMKKFWREGYRPNIKDMK